MARIASCRARVAVASLTAAASATAFDAQEFAPAVDPEGYFSAYSSNTTPKGRFDFSLWYNYVADPVTSHRFNDAYPNQLPAGEDLVATIHTSDVVASYSLLDWLEIGIDLPFSDVSTNFEGARSDIGLDSIRVMAKAQLLKDRWQGSASRSCRLSICRPATRNGLSSDGETDVGFLAVGDFVYERFRASLNGGYTFDDEFVTPLEMLGGARFYGDSGLYVTLGIGKALTRASTARRYG